MKYQNLGRKCMLKVTERAAWSAEYLDLDLKTFRKRLYFHINTTEHDVIITDVDDTAIYLTVDGKPTMVEITEVCGRISYHWPKEYVYTASAAESHARFKKNNPDYTRKHGNISMTRYIKLQKQYEELSRKYEELSRKYQKEINK